MPDLKTLEILASTVRTGVAGDIRRIDASIADRWIAAGLAREVSAESAKRLKARSKARAKIAKKASTFIQGGYEDEFDGQDSGGE